MYSPSYEAIYQRLVMYGVTLHYSNQYQILMQLFMTTEMVRIMFYGMKILAAYKQR